MSLTLFVCFPLYTVYTHLIVFCSCVYSYFSSCIHVIMCNNNLRVKFTFLHYVNLTYKGMSMHAGLTYKGMSMRAGLTYKGMSMRAGLTYKGVACVLYQHT